MNNLLRSLSTQTRLSTLLILSLLVSGCSHSTLNETNQFSNITRVNNDHRLVQHDLDVLYATVYFIRPKTEHPQGFADAPVRVEVDGDTLMKLGKAEYTMIHVKPRRVSITMRNKTQVRGRWEVEEMTATRDFNFKPGETYFIMAQPIDGEYRGARFIPTSLDTFAAKQASKYLSPVGKARRQQIANL